MLGLVLALAAMVAPAPATASPPLRVTLLGTGLPVPSATQFGPSTLVEVGDQAFLFDCGRGCSIRLTQARPALFNKLDRVFLTHLHSDHIVGLPDLWLNGWTQNRVTPLRVWGPPGTRSFMAGLDRAFAWDIDNRGVVEKVPAKLTGLRHPVTEISRPGVVYNSSGVRITAFIADHGAAKPALSYRVDADGRAVVLSGDTRLTPELIRQSRGADLLVQEVIPPALVDYLRHNYTPPQVATIIAHHTTVAEVGELTRAAHPRLLVYSHYPKSPDSDRRLTEDTSRVSASPFELGEDLMTIDVGATLRVCRPAGACTNIVERR